MDTVLSDFIERFDSDLVHCFLQSSLIKYNANIRKYQTQGMNHESRNN